MITTKKFSLTKKEYFSFSVRVLLKRIWWLFALLWLFSIVLVFTNKNDAFSNSFMAFGFIAPFYIFFSYWRFANSKENKSFFYERKYEIFTDKIFTYGETGQSQLGIENFIKTLELKDAYFLYLSKEQSLFMPKRIFETAEDENWFRNEVFLKIKNK